MSKRLNMLDIFAGIGSFSLAFERAGATTIAQVEIDPSRRDVLAAHFPNVRKLSDIREVTANDFNEPIDILVGGTPCQNLSIAGNGKGLVGEKSILWFEYLRLAQELKPRWLVWENVPNALSSNKGQDFLQILQGLDECGYHVAWRVLDAQYFGVPQRRRRIFLVGYLGDGRAAKVLFEPESLQGNSKTRPATWKNSSSKVAGTLAASGAGSARPAGQHNELDMLVFSAQGKGQYRHADASSTLTSRLCKQTDVDIVALNPQASVTANGIMRKDGVAGTLGTTRVEGVLESNAVRRFTPIECERLQGYPDNWTEGHSDTKRYQMLGDSIALPVSEWVAKRIEAFD